MSIDEACKNVVERIEGAVACGVVDLATGMLLGFHDTTPYSPGLREALALAVVELFRGPAIGRLEKELRAYQGRRADEDTHFEDVQLTSPSSFHFAKAIKDGTAAIVLVTDKSTNAGLGWAMLKSIVPEVERLVP